MESESRKRRFSNFDVSPEQLSAPSSISSYLSQQQSSLNNGFSFALHTLDSSVGSFGSVTDPIFTLRLKKALERNFDYILRKESQVAEAKIALTSYSGHNMKQHALLSAASVSTAAGLGAAKLIAQMNQQMAKHQQESVSVYVSNLPLDITEEELEILFGTVSSVAPGPRVKQPVKPLKRIRLYTDSVTGKKKGDALLTFSKPEYAKNAVSKYNEMDIGDGFVIKVVRADFQQSSKSKEGENREEEEEEQDTDWDDSNRPAPPPSAASDSVRPLAELRGSSSDSTAPSSNASGRPRTVHTSQSVGPDPAVLRASLPPECEAASYPVLVLLNLYTNASLTASVTTASQISGMPLEEAVQKFYDDLEADMLVECCSFGRVRYLQVLDLAEEMASEWGGGMAVTFEGEEAATKCATTFSRRSVGGKPVIAMVLSPGVDDSANSCGDFPSDQTENADQSGIGFTSGTSGYTPLDKLPSHIPPPPAPPKFVRPVAAAAAAPVSSVLVETVTSIERADAAAPGATEAVTVGDDLDVDDFLNSFL